MGLDFPPQTRARMLEVFGEDAMVNGQAVRGVFANAYVEIRGAEASVPSLLCRAEDLPNVAHEQVVIVAQRGFAGQVVSIQPDGEGWVLLVLHRTV